MFREWCPALFVLTIGCPGEVTRENVNEEIAFRDLEFGSPGFELRTVVGQDQTRNVSLRNTGSGAIALEAHLRAVDGAAPLPAGLDVSSFAGRNRVQMQLQGQDDRGQALATNERDLVPPGSGVFFLVRPGAEVLIVLQFAAEAPLPDSDYVFEYRVPDAGVVHEVPISVTIADDPSGLSGLEARPERIEMATEAGGIVGQSIQLSPPQGSTVSPSRIELRYVPDPASTPGNIRLASEEDPDPQILRVSFFEEEGFANRLPTVSTAGGVAVDTMFGCPCTAGLLFMPERTVNASGTIEVRDGAGNLLDTVDLVLRADEPGVARLTADPAQLDFGEIEIGQEVRRMLSLTNDSTVARSLSSELRIDVLDEEYYAEIETEVQARRFEPGETRIVQARLTVSRPTGLEYDQPTEGRLQFQDVARQVYLEVPITFTLVEPRTRAPAQVVVGPTHSCLRQDDGEALCWGENDEGQLGVGTRAPSPEPIPVLGLGPVVDLALGRNFTCALRDSVRDVACWGANQLGQSGAPGAERYVMPNSVSLPGLVVDISAGDDHACAVLETGAVHCWGYQRNGALGNDTVAMTGIAPTPVPVTRADGAPLTGAVAIDGGPDVTCAVLDDMGARRVECWGDGFYGAGGARPDPSTMDDPQPLVGDTTIADAVDVAIERRHGCVRRGASGGEIWCFGENVQGAVGVPGGQSQVGLTQVSLPAPAVDVSVGRDFSCATVQGAAPRCWGSNFYFGGGGQAGGGGQLGAKLDRDALFPPTEVLDFLTGAALGGGTDAVEQISSYTHQTCALADTGALWCWGGATYLGDLQALGVGMRGYDRYAAVPVQGGYRASLDAEIGYCGNGSDDDGDMLVDFDDPDCATDLGSMLTFASSARGQGNDAPKPCSIPGPWRDQVLRWVAPSTARYEVRTEFRDFFIAVSDTNDLSSELGCKTNTNDPLLVDATVGQAYYILLANDGRSGIDDYTLQICENACN